MTAYDDWVQRARMAPIESEIIRRGIKLCRSGQERVGPCPKCGGTDRFSINVKDNVWNCRQCKPANISGDVIGLVEWLDGADFNRACETLTQEPMPAGAGASGNGADRHGREVAWYDYMDEGGALLFQVVRFEPKNFRQRRPAGDGWSWSVKGVRPVPYRLPQLIEAIASERTVFITEGEKDVETLAGLGVVATTNAGGAGKWRKELNQYFADADVVIIADYDPQATNKKTGEPLKHDDGRPRIPGLDHAMAVAAELKPIARDVRMFVINELWPQCPLKGDVSDYLAAGGSIEALNDFVAELQSWTPEQRHETAPELILSQEEFVRGFVPPDYLIFGMLQRRFLYSLTGQTGHAKTAIALLIAELVASAGANYLGTHRVESGRALYLIGENADDLRMRVIGSDHYSNDLYFVEGVVDIEKIFGLLETELRRIGGVDLIIVDTSAAYFLGDDEISNTQMGAHARKLRRLTLLPGHPCVLVLCHPIKHVIEPSMLVPRGGGAFLAEMDGNLTAWRKDETIIELHHSKMRGPGFEPMTFKLETVKTDRLRDAQGRQLPTVRAVAASQAEEDQQRDRADDDDDKMLIARLNIGDEAKMSVADFAKRWGWSFDDGAPAKSRAQRALRRNVENKLMRNERGQYLLTEKGKEAARKAVLRMEREQAGSASQAGFDFAH